jgi:hypothetical protein
MVEHSMAFQVQTFVRVKYAFVIGHGLAAAVWTAAGGKKHFVFSFHSSSIRFEVPESLFLLRTGFVTRYRPPVHQYCFMIGFINGFLAERADDGGAACDLRVVLPMLHIHSCDMVGRNKVRRSGTADFFYQ